MLIVMDDLNAKIGAGNKRFEDVMGRQGCGVKNVNGFLFAEYCHTQVVGI